MLEKINKIFLDCLLFVVFSSWSVATMGGESFIPLQRGIRAASDDLIYNNKVLSSREASALATQNNIDLAKLSPKENALWGESENLQLNDQEAIAINDNDTLTFEGSLKSNLGLYRFNAIPLNGNKIYTIHLDKSLHSILLRKNLLRKLGYKIPAMKYLKKVVVQFNTKNSLDHFLSKEIPDGTLGASSRWASVDLVSENSLSVTLKDVAVTEPSEFDNYNLSIGVPTMTMNGRTLRALIVPYSLIDLYESINKFSWVNGKIDNQSIILEHFTGNGFSTTVDDFLWIQEKLNGLSRTDFKEIIEKAYFPPEVGAILLEKIISRRNSMNRLLKIDIEDIDFDAKITIDKKVKKGKLLENEYPGYASRFAHGDADSPFDQLSYFIYSKVQSNVIDNLINELNSKLTVNSSEARVDYYKKQFQNGLDHFVKTGEFLPIGVGAWIGPIARGQLIFSRDIILGNYLGTNNLVQLVDTFGASATLGINIGIEGLGNNLAPSFSATTSIVRTYSHLKPIKSLKESLKEPYKNIFVGFIKNSLKDDFFSLSELKDYQGPATNNADSAPSESSALDPEAKPKTERMKKVEALLKAIDTNLNIGESLILTDRVMPSVNVSLNFTTGIVGAGVGISAGGGVTILKRIHLYKKSPSVLQIYDDSGFVKDLNMSFQLNKFITFLKLDGKFDSGHYNVNSYMVDLTSDPEKNPNLFSNAQGVYNVLESKNFELLEQNNPPVKLDVDFKDRVAGFSLLLFKIKSLSGKTQYDISAKNGVKGSYFSLEKNFLMGISPETFTKQVINYYLAKEVKDFSVAVTDDSNNIPGQSIFGRSRTERLRFEAVLDENKKFDQKYLSFTDVKQGWVMSKKNIKKFMRETNEKFQAPLFEIDKIDFSKIRLYSVGYSLSLYDRGIERVNSIASNELDELENKYISQAGCYFNDPNIGTRKCGDLRELRKKIKSCAKKRDEEDKAGCTLELFEKLMADLEFGDFRKLLGDKNFYLYGTIDGFRVKSEVLNDTIQSNTIGQIGSKQWDGPISVVRDLLGISAGEFRGNWLREVF